MIENPAYLVEVTPEERALGQLNQANANRAYSAMNLQGFAILRGCFSPAHVADMHREYQAQYGAMTEADMRVLAGKASPVLEVDKGRFEIVLKLVGAFDIRAYASDLLLRFLIPLMGSDLRLSSVTAVTSYPGAVQQRMHRDAGHLFPEFQMGPTLPTYAVNVTVPLIDVDATMGPTGVWPGSHRLAEGKKPPEEGLLTVPFLKGDAILIDYRTLHAGLPNLSQNVRPILYMVYARSWFVDDTNHRLRSPLNMPLETFRALPDNLKPLLMRAYSQIVRAKGLS
ncbi:MAG: phytanoyl-CoA dioxygenase family protein [Rhodospirillaceae bacterium]|nr:phytanoyl-CoA dioxygenase family protein [Rhodospirillaceae bacterium]